MANTNIVIGVKRFDFVSEKGERIKGTKVHYLDSVPVTGDGQGYQPITINCSYDLYPQFKEVPGNYILEFAARPGANNKLLVKLVGATYYSEVTTL